MAITFTLDGTPFTPQQGWNIADVSLGRSRFVCVVRSDDGSFSASAGDELEVDDGSTSLFGGFVTTVTVTARANDLGSDATDTRIEAEDYNGLPARRIVTEDIVTGNLKAAATVLVTNYLDDLGVSLHPSQVNGPTLPAISWLAVSGFDALNQLSEMSGGYVWTIDASKQLRFQVPGTDAAPFDVTDNTYLDDGDVEVSRSRQVFANTIVAVVGTASVVDKTDTFDGDGTTDEFTLTYPVTGNMIGVVTVTEPGPIYRYETIDEIGVGAYWEIDRVNNSIQVGNHVNSQIPASGEDISFRYLAQFPITVTATDAPSVAADGVYEQRIDLPDVFDAAQAQAIVDGLLARGVVEKTTITYVTAESGLAVNQLQRITLPNRGIDADCIITGLVTLSVGGSRILRTVTAVIGDQVLGSWRDVYTSWLGGGMASTHSGSAVVPAYGNQQTAVSISATDFGAEPASPALGDVDLYLNAPMVARFEANEWKPYGPIYRFITPPTTGWSWVNQGSATEITTYGGRLIEAPYTSSDNIIARVRTAPSTPYVITAFIDGHRIMRNWQAWGLCWRESGTGEIINVMVDAAALPPGAVHLSVHKLNSPTSYNAVYANSQQPTFGPLHWLRIADDGANRIVSISHDGNYWIEYHTIGRTDFMTADQVGFCIQTYNVTGTYDSYAHLLSWEES